MSVRSIVRTVFRKLIRKAVDYELEFLSDFSRSVGDGKFVTKNKNADAEMPFDEP